MRRSPRRQLTGMHSAVASGFALASLLGCGSDAPRPPDRAKSHAEATRPGPEEAAGAAVRSVPTVTRPADDCGWISAAEVEQIVGPLAGPPRATGDGCVYPLVKDSTTLAREERARALQKKLEQAFGPSTLPKPDSQEVAVVIDVAENVNPGTGLDPSRAGHLGVWVRSEGSQVSPEQRARIAALVRDSIPDLPFAYPSDPDTPANGGSPKDRDPCGLLTPSEAEAVLGKLLVPPYHSHEDTPLAQPGGKSCAYFTSGHRALVLTPTWEYGGQVVDAIRSIGGIVGLVVQADEEAADTLDGPWDEAGSDPMTGSLYFLKGERVLVIHHLASAAGYEGAVRLARTALERLGDGTDERRAAAKRDAGGSPCPSPSDLGTAAGFELTFTQALGVADPWMTCQYELAGRYRGTFLKLTVQPRSHADRLFAQVQRTAKARKGKDAGADRIALGDGGWAYGSGRRSQAAAIVRGRLYTADLEYSGLGSIGDQKEAMVRVLEAASR